MSKLLEGEKAIVTGASSGIGKGIARVFAREGADVVFTYRSNKSGADTALKELQSYGGKVLALKTDIVKTEDIDAMLKSAIAFLGGLDIMVNNAGITSKYNFLDISEAEYDELFNINCRGTFFCAQRAARYMKVHNGGSIVNISSLSSRASSEGFSTYAATKAAINKFTETAAIELAPDHIRVNAVAAGWVPVESEGAKTEEYIKKALYHLPIGRLGLADDIGEMCAFLASDRAGFITGQTFFVDGGQTCLLSIPSKSREERFSK
ncbi:MAG: Oxidoreductase, short chain dehydrogenase/reductase family [Candidatus Uhrbacteria bacterium GW2011_GWF2_39_13]|uniref:Oxidoreductase, short chain dehydrogenase/reductase family n=1 Tax=Candidatus Uhrbacteria bacterium GW2011_GWF2_39_13 TaxID=1618995 RepID=A0A0G0MKJ6_9BACT|nr:MAG: Oxidoreductase, short chain dehydrogenase/reductase family [Candidatus Uhrbacteria bacterium GW2011_GWF2_39_13]